MSNWARGFVYCVTSEDYLPPCMASIHSLRQFHKERIQISWGTHIWHAYTKHAKFLLQQDLWAVPISMARYPSPRHSTHPHFLTKNLAFIASPFEQTIFLDADTLIRKPLDAMWTNGITIAQLGKQERNGKPLVTTGVVGFGKRRDIWLEIQRTAPALSQGQQRRFNELYSPAAVKVVGVEYNCPVGEHNRCPDPVVAHLDGRAWEGDNKYSGAFNRHMKEAAL